MGSQVSTTSGKPSGSGALIAIVAMSFLFAMIAFVTNLAAPLGTIWKGHYEWAGMVGNFMNFLAYLIMGIPAGMLLQRIGYKKTALLAMAIGRFLAVSIQHHRCRHRHVLRGRRHCKTRFYHLSPRCVRLRFLRLHPQYGCQPDAQYPRWRR